MCFGSPKMPDPPKATPAPSPSPVITPSEVSPQEKAEGRRKKLARLKYGLASTIKTSPRGIFGTGAELTSQPSQ